MRRRIFLFLIFLLSITAISFAESQGLLIDNFEGLIVGGPQGTVDYGAGGGSSLEVGPGIDIKYSGNQSLKITFDAVTDGYMWVARGFDLDAKNAVWAVRPEDVQWGQYNAIAFYMYGSDSKAKVAFDIKDNGNELWRFMLEDDFKGWKRIVCSFSDFFTRGDWQPGNADNNAALDFPLKSFQFEPRPEAKGDLYFDEVEIIQQ